MHARRSTATVVPASHTVLHAKKRTTTGKKKYYAAAANLVFLALVVFNAAVGFGRRSEVVEDVVVEEEKKHVAVDVVGEEKKHFFREEEAYYFRDAVNVPSLQDILLRSRAPRPKRPKEKAVEQSAFLFSRPLSPYARSKRSKKEKAAEKIALFSHRHYSPVHAEKGESCTAGVNGSFSLRNDAMVRMVMLRIKHKQPWGWIRFADGDINDLEGHAAAGVGPRLRSAIEKWPEMNNLVVSVGSWWLCSDPYKDIWNKHMRADVLRNFTFYDHCFYLPMGTPDDDDLYVWEERGVRGWVRMAQESNVPTVLVGSESLRTIPWLSGPGSAYIASTNLAHDPDRLDRALRECEEASAKHGSEPVLFVFSAGSAAKIMITELMRAGRSTSKDMFVDAGTALDGFAGTSSRAFNSGAEFTRKYCVNILRRDPEQNLDRWLAPGVSTNNCSAEREQERHRFEYDKYCRAWRQTGGCDPGGGCCVQVKSLVTLLIRTFRNHPSPGINPVH